MSWHGIQGHDEIVEQFRNILQSQRLASTYLFVGPAGVGKRTFALKLAQALLCQNRSEELLDPCDTCAACKQVLASTHPDLIQVGKPKEKSFIPVDTFIGTREKRNRQGLCHEISLKPFMGGRKIAIIDDADYLNEEGANCLLKTLEEPPPKSLLILIGTSAEKQLPTIRSRCQTIRFRRLSIQTVAELLLAGTDVITRVEDPQEAQRLASHSGGSLEQALALADPELWTFRGQLISHLAEPQLESVRVARMVQGFVEEAGREAPARRARCRQVIRFAVDFYRQLVRASCGMPPNEDLELNAVVNKASAAGLNNDQALACLDRSLKALETIDRNVHLTTLIECWLDDLHRIVTTGQTAAL